MGILSCGIESNMFYVSNMCILKSVNLLLLPFPRETIKYHVRIAITVAHLYC